MAAASCAIPSGRPVPGGSRRSTSRSGVLPPDRAVNAQVSRLAPPVSRRRSRSRVGSLRTSLSRTASSQDSTAGSRASSWHLPVAGTSVTGTSPSASPPSTRPPFRATLGAVRPHHVQGEPLVVLDDLVPAQLASWREPARDSGAHNDDRPGGLPRQRGGERALHGALVDYLVEEALLLQALRFVLAAQRLLQRAQLARAQQGRPLALQMEQHLHFHDGGEPV